MIVHVDGGAMAARREVERAIASMLSLVDTARRSPVPGGTRFDRGSLVLVVGPRGLARWRDSTAGRALAVDLHGVVLREDGGDARLDAMEGLRDAAATIAAAYATPTPHAGLVSPGTPLRPAYVALRAAAALAGMRWADLTVSHPFRGSPGHAVLHHDGPGPLGLAPAVHAALMDDVEEARTLTATTSGGVVRAGIEESTWCEEIDDHEPMAVIRLLAETGLDAQALRLAPWS